MRMSKIKEGSKLYNDALDLRYELFFKKFDLPKDVTADDLEPDSTHVVISEDNELIAYGRLSPLEIGTFRISQIIVQPDQRRKGYASKIVFELIKLAKVASAKNIVLNSQLSAASLYENLGFHKVGKVYKVKLTGVSHQKMQYKFKT